MCIRLRRLTRFLDPCVAALMVLLVTPFPADAAPPDTQKSAASPGPEGQSPPSPVQSFDKAEEVKYSWGWIRWLMSSKIDPQAEMTFGIVYVKPHQKNPMHVHPNCAEYLHMLSGSCEHLVGDKWLSLKAGDTVRIPAGVPHVARTLDEPMRAVIVYSSGDRQFEPVEEEEKE
jgi:quercetin dioxygenase-like cupin family protein